MFRKTFPLFLTLSLLSILPLTTAQAQTASLTAPQIVEKNIAARGGLQAWRGLQTMTWTGKMDAGGGDSAARSRRAALAPSSSTNHAVMNAPEGKTEQVQLPFTLYMKRGRKSRIELEFAGKKPVQVYDGTNGWKYRPFLNREDVEPFTNDELKSEAQKSDLDGPLVDYATKGTKVESAGVEKVEGHDCYKLKLTLKSGDVQYVWIDTQSFLDVKVSGTPRRMDGRMHNVYIYQRDFKTVQGLVLPQVLETAVDGYRDTHKMVIESLVINPKLDDSLFKKPQSK
ncbi:MAG: outer membrane lipoprotein-sorting protein [Acidobacteria bacterium]|nr:MAG: outer membrane lipoprotein-sorting protein [Acidobacteriota bacterium]PYX40989.1 MAG: outer membrane lipoprotein-sorting protein [Acidobacteriota bacterium]